MADVWSYFEMAGKLATKRRDNRNYYLSCVARRADGALIKATNGSPWKVPIKSAHAEFRACLKLDYNAEIWVVRIKIGDGSFGMARPCDHCMGLLLSKKCKKIFYTINSHQYGLIYCNNGYIVSEKVYNKSSKSTQCS